MKISSKLILGFGLLIAAVAVVAFFGIEGMRSMNANVDDLVHDKFPKSVWTNNIIDAVNDDTKATRNQFLSDDPNVLRNSREWSKNASDKVNENFAKLEENINSAEGIKLLKNIHDIRHNKYYTSRQELFDSLQAGRRDAAERILFGDFDRASSDYLNAVLALIEYQNQLVEQSGAAAIDQFESSRNMLYIIAGLAVILGIAILLVVLRSIKLPINRAINVANSIAEGDFSVDAKTDKKDETGQLLSALDSMKNSMKSLIDELNVISNKALEGELDYRADSNKHKGEYKNLVVGVNAILDAVLKPVIESTRVLRKIRGGNLTEQVAIETKGDHSKLKDAVNGVHLWLGGLIDYVKKIAEGNMNAEMSKASEEDQIHEWLILMRENIKALVTDANRLAAAGVAGKLQERADVNRHSGAYRDVIEGINKTLDNIVTLVYEAIENMEKLADGDWTNSMKGDYKGDGLKLKNALNSMTTAMNDVLSQVKGTVEEVTAGAMQVSDASTSLSQGATEQAASLEEITSSITQLSAQTNTNAENANQANMITNEAKISAERGNQEMVELNNAMNDISKSSRNISKIIKVIDEIAFQTNLLALNAAVEAARAGRHGKGFAVVAEEVRNLAARSAKAAKETSDMIEGSLKIVENGSMLANRTREALEEISKGSVKAADIVGEIATSSNEQAQGISQINEGLMQIDKVTQTNTASAEESASAAEQLSSQATQLKHMIANFKLAEVAMNRYAEKNDGFRTSYVSSGRDYGKSLPAAKGYDDEAYIRKANNPNDIINLDEDDFGKY